MSVIVNVPRPSEDAGPEYAWRCQCGRNAFNVLADGTLRCVSCRHVTVGEPHQYGYWIKFEPPEKKP